MDAFSPLFIVVIILGTAGVIAVFVVWEFRAAKERRDDRRWLAQELGFQDAPGRTRDLAKRLQVLHHHGSEHHSVENPRRRSEPGYELFLFDLNDPSGDSVGPESDQAVLISPDLRLPRFSLFPKMRETGVLASMTNKALGWVASKFAVQAAFPDAPGFDAKYLVWGDDEAALRGCFSPLRLGRLAQTGDLELVGSGDALLFSWVFEQGDDRTEEEKLQDTLKTAKLLFDILKT